MARLDDAKDGLKAISVHADALLDAYLNTQSRLLDTEQNQSAIKSMLKHHLAWQIAQHHLAWHVHHNMRFEWVCGHPVGAAPPVLRGVR